MDAPLLLGIGVYVVSSLGGVSVVKLMNYRYCMTSWRTFALLSRSTWILSAILHSVLKRREGVAVSQYSGPSGRQLRLYCAIAMGLSLVEAVNSFSMSMLPGSLYMLLKGSDVGWSMILSYFMLKKSYGATKIAAAALILLGIGVTLMLDTIGGGGNTNRSQESDDVSTTANGVSTATAAMLCLGGAFLNSLCSVGTEATLKQTLREEEEEGLNLQTQQHSTAPPRTSSAIPQRFGCFNSFPTLFDAFPGHGRRNFREHTTPSTPSIEVYHPFHHFHRFLVFRRWMGPPSSQYNASIEISASRCATNLGVFAHCSVCPGLTPYQISLDDFIRKRSTFDTFGSDGA